MTTINAYDYSVGEILTAAIMDGVTADLNTLLTEVEGSCYVESGTYTGDGSTGNTVSLADTEMIIKALWIIRDEGDGVNSNMWYTTSEFVDNDAQGLCIIHGAAIGIDGQDQRIISLGTGGFVVGDEALDREPNKNGAGYYYMAWGTH